MQGLERVIVQQGIQAWHKTDTLSYTHTWGQASQWLPSSQLIRPWSLVCNLNSTKSIFHPWCLIYIQNLVIISTFKWSLLLYFFHFFFFPRRPLRDIGLNLFWHNYANEGISACLQHYSCAKAAPTHLTITCEGPPGQWAQDWVAGPFYLIYRQSPPIYLL